MSSRIRTTFQGDIMELVDWKKPLTKIARYMCSNKTEFTEVIRQAGIFKNLFDQTGVCVSSMNKIVEVSNTREPKMKKIVAVLGFRGEYTTCKKEDVVGEYDLCISHKKFGRVSNIEAKSFISYG